MRRRVVVGAGVLLVVAGIAVALTDPFAGSPPAANGASDNGTATSTATIARQDLSQYSWLFSSELTLKEIFTLLLNHLGAEHRQFDDLMPQRLGIGAGQCSAAAAAGRWLEGNGRLGRLQQRPLLLKVSGLATAAAPGRRARRGAFDGGRIGGGRPGGVARILVQGASASTCETQFVSQHDKGPVPAKHSLRRMTRGQYPRTSGPCGLANPQGPGSEDYSWNSRSGMRWLNSASSGCFVGSRRRSW